ncbi:hypothetical protein OO009_14845 [Flavobacteriaceae bacterium KMM 6897]|nr:hypothetical protein [Flavobacteriaceae bacterium KMM 6897]MEB8347296.1 hypothetical protein [Flavobacteriaceae bacterium KMM 6898]
MMGKVISSVVLIVLVCFGCTDRDDSITMANIRVKNVSELNFDSVQVGAEDKIHENVATGAFSAYLEYETAYSYDYIKITSGEEGVFILQPIDFVGETPLTPGFYTYELNVLETGEVQLEFVVD